MFFMHLNQIQDEAHTSLKGKLKISNTKMLNRVTWMIIRQIYWWKCKDNSNSVCHVFQALKRHLANLKIEACWVFIIGSPVYLYLKLLCLCLCSWKSYALKAGFIDILCHFRAAERVVPQYSLVLDMSFYVLSKQMPMQLLHIYHTPGNERYSLSVLLYIGLHWNWEHCMVILLLSASMDSTNFCWAGGLQCFFSCTLNKVNEITHLMHIFGQ